MRQIVITISTCDNKYLDVLKAFLMSFRLNAGESYLIRAILVNGNDSVFAGLKRIYPNLEIEPASLPAKDWTVKENLVELLYLRPAQMVKTLKEGWDQVLSIDSDTLIRRSLEGLWSGVGAGVLKIWDRGAKKKFQGGVYLLGNSTEVLEFYECVATTIGTNFRLKDGQSAMWSIYWEKFKDKVKHVQLSDVYNDSKSHPDSIIWHCKHGHMDENKAFKNALSGLLAQAEKYYTGELK